MSRYDGRTFTTFTIQDGLAHNWVYSMFQDREGRLWFGTHGGVSWYSGEVWATFTAQEGLAENQVWSMLQDREGHLWFGTRGGVSRYDGQTFTTFTTKDGLVHRWVNSIFQDGEGHLWFGTHGGVSRYDGQGFTTISIADGLVDNGVLSMLQDGEGHLWFGTEGGISRYDGQMFTNFTTEGGLPHNQVNAMLQDREGYLWFGTERGGMCRYDGQGFTTFTTADGLADNEVESMFQDRDGHLWFGTEGGVSRYDGQGFTTFITQDGLAGNDVRSMFQDRDGQIWFGTWGGGVSRYDGQAFQTLIRGDGLPGNSAAAMLQDRDGYIWIGIPNRGVTRYRPPPPVPPPVVIGAVVTDRRYEGVSELAVSSGVGLIAFEFHGISFKTRPEAMVYRYRLKDYEVDWQTTHARRVEYQDLPRGTYTFEVQAVDRDLVYSEMPAAVALSVHLPYERIGLLSALGIAVVLIAWQAMRVVQSNVALRKAHGELELRVEERTAELSKANAMLKEEMAERKQAERRLVRLERLRALGEMSAGISHNLNNILTGIMGPAELLKLSSDDPEVLQDAEAIFAAAIRARDLVRRLHRSVRGEETDSMEPVSLDEVVREAVHEASPRWKDEPEARGITVEVVTDLVDVPPIEGTQSGLHNILINLLFNAVDAMPEGGTLKIGTKTAGEDVQLTVSDTGIGMDEEIRRRVFEPFFTTKMDVGTGLGLSTVYSTVTRWGGSIEVESTPGEGTTFTLRFPVWKGPESEGEAHTGARRTRRGKVLVVEDEAAVYNLLARVLSAKHEVETVGNGAEALEQFAPRRYDVVLIDLGMPGMPGDEVAQEIRKQDVCVATVLITGWELQPDDPRVSAFDFRIQKPFENIDMILDVVAQGIELRDDRAEA